MIIIKLVGGFGNQFQQYALYKKMLKVGADKDIKFEISWYDKEFQRAKWGEEWPLDLVKFEKLTLPICSKDEYESFLVQNRREGKGGIFFKKNPIFIEKKMYHPEVFKIRNMCIEGVFTCQKYYDDVLEEVRKDFIFPKYYDEKKSIIQRKLLDEIDDTHSVSIHIRRGDYLQAENRGIFDNIATERYYTSAIAYFKEKYEKVHFYVFCEDSTYAKNKYCDTNLFTVIDHNNRDNAIFDIQLMSRCKGLICANSTFSFLGVRLNSCRDREVIRPLVMRNNQRVSVRKMHEYWPGWILMDKNGVIR